MLFMIALVVLFSPVKLRRRCDLCHNLPEPEYTRHLNFLLRFSRQPCLFCIMIKNHGTVIGANVRTLAVQLCRVMDRPEHIQEMFVADLYRIIHNLDDLCMTGLPGAYILVSRIF